GFLFGLGGMLAGGCGSGTLWRVGEGQLKLWIVVPFFGIANSLMTKWFKAAKFEDEGILGRFIYMPDTLGYGLTLGLITFMMALWYVVVTWNEDSNKLIVPM
ncbi:YeeE/YedE family protein, partial [Desulfobulbus sp. F3]|nr:YeeE/YedE family protein [Desulfobulbus sp. F3]